MIKRIAALHEWLAEQYEDYCFDYESTHADYRSLYRALCEVIGSTITELNELIENEQEEFENEMEDHYEYDGQPDDLQENEDFAHDGHFENMECGDDGFWHG